MYELQEHTADLKARLWAPDEAGLYASAADLIRDILVGGSPVGARRRLTLQPESDEPGERFFRFVRELVYLYDVDRFVPREVVSMEPLLVTGETYDPRRHRVEHVPKAVTRHRFLYSCDRDGCRAELVIDL